MKDVLQVVLKINGLLASDFWERDMNDMVYVGEDDQRIAAGFCSIEYDHWPRVSRGTKLREVLLEEESLETRQFSNILEQAISFYRQRTVSVTLLLQRSCRTWSRFGDGGQRFLVSGTSTL